MLPLWIEKPGFKFGAYYTPWTLEHWTGQFVLLSPQVWCLQNELNFSPYQEAVTRENCAWHE